MRQIAKFARPENGELVPRLAKRMLELRDPQDAWALGDLGQYLAYMDLQDEAIDYERQALKIMSYGVARTNLAALLYAKAAALQESGKPNGKVLAEADALEVPEESVLEWYQRTSVVAKVHASSVIRLFESRQRK